MRWDGRGVESCGNLLTSGWELIVALWEGWPDCGNEILKLAYNQDRDDILVLFKDTLGGNDAINFNLPLDEDI